MLNNEQLKWLRAALTGRQRHEEVADFLEDCGCNVGDVLAYYAGMPPYYRGGLPAGVLAVWLRSHGHEAAREVTRWLAGAVAAQEKLAMGRQPWQALKREILHGQLGSEESGKWGACGGCMGWGRANCLRCKGIGWHYTDTGGTAGGLIPEYFWLFDDGGAFSARHAVVMPIVPPHSNNFTGGNYRGGRFIGYDRRGLAVPVPTREAAVGTSLSIASSPEAGVAVAVRPFFTGQTIPLNLE